MFYRFIITTLFVFFSLNSCSRKEVEKFDDAPKPLKKLSDKEKKRIKSKASAKVWDLENIKKHRAFLEKLRTKSVEILKDIKSSCLVKTPQNSIAQKWSALEETLKNEVTAMDPANRSALSSLWIRIIRTITRVWPVINKEICSGDRGAQVHLDSVKESLAEIEDYLKKIEKK